MDALALPFPISTSKSDALQSAQKYVQHPSHVPSHLVLAFCLPFCLPSLDGRRTHQSTECTNGWMDAFTAAGHKSISRSGVAGGDAMNEGRERQRERRQEPWTVSPSRSDALQSGK